MTAGRRRSHFRAFDAAATGRTPAHFDADPVSPHWFPMGRLSNIKPALAAPPARLRLPPKNIDELYSSREWRQLIARIKNERGRFCQRCGSANRVAGDHVRELRDGGAAFDESNIELLCAACHNRKTHAERARRAVGGT